MGREVGLTYFTCTISPVLISFAAAATRVGVNKFNRPIKSSLPQTQAASSGAPSIAGNSFRVGNLVEFGSHGIVVAVLFPVRKSLTCVRRRLAVFFWDAMVDSKYYSRKDVLGCFALRVHEIRMQ